MTRRFPTIALLLFGLVLEAGEGLVVVFPPEVEPMRTLVLRSISGGYGIRLQVPASERVAEASFDADLNAVRYRLAREDETALDTAAWEAMAQALTGGVATDATRPLIVVLVP